METPTTKLLIAIFTFRLITQFSAVNSANILFLSGMPSPSHHIWNKSIMKGLVDRGHNLTMLTVEEHDISSKNMHFIQMNGLYDAIAQYLFEETEQNIESDMKISVSRRSSFLTAIEIYSFAEMLNQIMIKTDGAKQLYNYPKNFKFDLVINDYTSTPILLGFVDHFGNPPLVSISAYNIPPNTVDVSGVVSFPSYLPYLGLEFTNKMTFKERVLNLCYWTFDYLYRQLIFMSAQNKLAREYFGPNLPSLQSIQRDSELVLVNINWSIDYAQLLPPNIIPVGGLQVKRVEPLEDELATFMNNTKNGVVLFSLGTNVKSSHLGSTIYTFLNAFRELKEYDFIWKFETDELENIPENLLIRKFLPQNSILAHPNIKMFMTHGGLLSMQESLWYGVPLLGFPIFSDQYQNMLKVRQNGLGEELNIQNLTVPLLVDSIRKVIENPSYKQTASKKSKLFRSQPMHPLDRAMFWIEHVLENNGAEHLKLGNSHLNTIQLYMLDVFGVILFILFLVLMIFVKYCCCRRDRGSSADHQINNNKKKYN